MLKLLQATASRTDNCVLDQSGVGFARGLIWNNCISVTILTDTSGSG